MRHGVVVRFDDPLAGDDAVALSELAHRPLLVPGPELASAQRAAIVRAGRDAGYEPELVTPAVPFDPGFRAVSFGRGVAIAPESAQERLPHELCWVPLEGGVLDGIATLAWDPARSSPARDLFLEVAERVRAREGWSVRSGW
jgi:DNA-binding transcriptional LysR family regulator